MPDKLIDIVRQHSRRFQTRTHTLKKMSANQIRNELNKFVFDDVKRRLIVAQMLTAHTIADEIADVTPVKSGTLLGNLSLGRKPKTLFKPRARQRSISAKKRELSERAFKLAREAIKNPAAVRSVYVSQPTPYIPFTSLGKSWGKIIHQSREKANSLITKYLFRRRL